MLRLTTIVILSIYLSIVSACQMLVPPELLNGCTFSPLTITNPTNGYTVNRFNCNEVINKDVFTEQPYVYFSNAEEEKSYTLLMVDPDSPLHNAGQFYLHWAVTNVPGYILKQGLGCTVGDLIFEYTGPSPAAFSGPHRFMIFAYVQMSNYLTAPLPAYRSRFVLMDWLDSFGGEDTLRGPVASVGYITEF
ncbi:Phosphatidylethanolamine-binding protein 4 [Pseudolycoriella hygida]|uniref:Phosphatidylethanolamine-binding protein 4 n=1 Tax=Pseudolycoriella hygida TaxID=35572 RepID=A0A9Q0MRV3_9DIPT|nr:Phosphatidylethanolamine-binding protein 4 [Pseudolycoriella hygida]